MKCLDTSVGLYSVSPLLHFSAASLLRFSTEILSTGMSGRMLIISNIFAIEPRLSEPHGRHTIGSDKRKVRIDGVATETSISSLKQSMWWAKIGLFAVL